MLSSRQKPRRIFTQPNSYIVEICASCLCVTIVIQYLGDVASAASKSRSHTIAKSGEGETVARYELALKNIRIVCDGAEMHLIKMFY